MDEIVRHKVRGTTYKVLGQATVQLSKPAAAGCPDYTPVGEGNRFVIYRGGDGRLWARFPAEFHDGRFEDITPVRRWWPDEYADEVMPTGTFSPNDWILGRSSAGWVLAPHDRDDAYAYSCLIVAEGDTVGFDWMEPRGSSTITVHPDGSWSGTEPEGYTWCWDIGDSEMSGESIDALVRDLLDMNPIAVGGAEVRLRFCEWGHAVFRLVVEKGDAKFAPEDASAYAAVAAEQTAQVDAMVTDAGGSADG